VDSEVLPAAYPLAAVTLICLFIEAAVQQPGRNVGRRMVVVRSNCSRIVAVSVHGLSALRR